VRTMSAQPASVTRPGGLRVDDGAADAEPTRFALETARVGVWELDLRTRRVRWSEMTALMLGCPPGVLDASDEAFFDPVHVDDRGAVRQAIERAIALQQDFAIAVRVVGPDDATRWIERRGRVRYDRDGVATRIIGADTDVTERKLLEAELRHVQRMEAIGQIAGGIAHDFNNLLTAILGYARVAAEGLAPGDRRRLDLDQVLKAAHLGSGLTRQLLALSRKPTLRPAFIDLNALLSGLSQMVRLITGEHIKVEIVLAPDLAMVRADEGQLEQIVVNLAVDARDVMEPGARLTFETANVQLHAASGLPGQTVVPGWYVMLALEPFPRTREHGGGPCPGLATVHDIVKQSDGFIRIDGLPGSGSALKVYLPRAERPVEAGAPAGGRPA
jgi:two-component system cell cycle sensor histidine kinase/response regulator CckA